MNQAIRRRLKALEQAAPDDARQIDFTGLDPQERAELRTILEGVADRALTPDEARALAAQRRIGAR